MKVFFSGQKGEIIPFSLFFHSTKMLHCFILSALLCCAYSQSPSYKKEGLIVIDESLRGYSYYEGPLQYIPDDQSVKEKEKKGDNNPTAQECYKKCERCLCEEDYWDPDCYYCNYCAENYVWECCDHCGGQKPHKPQPPKPQPPKPDDDDNESESESENESAQLSHININISNDCSCNYDDANNYNLTALCTQDNDPILAQNQNQSVPLNLNNTFQVPITVSTSGSVSGTINLLGAVEGLLNEFGNTSLGTCLIGCPLIAENCYSNLALLFPACVDTPALCFAPIIAAYTTCSTELTVCLTRECGGIPPLDVPFAKRDIYDDDDDDTILDTKQDSNYVHSTGEEYIKFIIEDEEDAYDAITKELMRFIIEKYVKKQ